MANPSIEGPPVCSNSFSTLCHSENRGFELYPAFNAIFWQSINPRLLVVLVLVVGYILFRHLISYWWHLRHGSRAARVAASTLRALRAARPAVYGPTRHFWCPTTAEAETSPLLCVACLRRINFRTTTSNLQRCCACGVVAHDSCVPHVGETCRPLTARESAHFWTVIGTCQHEKSILDLDRTGKMDGTGTFCIYCAEDVGGGVTSAEPCWQCACCAVACHVHCFCDMHPEFSSVSAKFKSKLDHMNAAGGFLYSEPSDPGMPGDSPRAEGVSPLSDEYVDTFSSSSRALNGQDAVGTGRQVALTRPNFSAQRDTCSSGTLQRMILPPTCVERRDPGGNGPAVAEKSNDIKVGEQEQNTKKDTNEHDRKAAGEQIKVSTTLQQKSRQRQRWWRRAFGPLPLQWSDWQIKGLPVTHRPILVFINTRSGPQIGETLRQLFLRILHPLQVVSLPRDSPEPALNLFCKVPGLRILCLGGDGTVGWIMTCLETLAKKQNDDDSNASNEWVIPPIAVIPLGTGNDLARCLGWSGSYKTWRSGGPAGMMRAVSEATTVLMDRWNVILMEHPHAHAEKPDLTLGPINITASPLRFWSGDRSTQTREAAAAPAVYRAMNNYLGIGVDAKVALEFHELRDAYPHWFQSQFGNKLMYTGVGALDIVGQLSGGGHLNLPAKVVVECDGDLVPLPRGAEGVLVVNIPSYMGGVDLWKSSAFGSSAGGSSVQGVQSMNDGLLEIVAVYGSWHLGRLTVGLSQAVRLRHGKRIAIHTSEALPMQIDGEPFIQPAGSVEVTWRRHARVLKRVENKPIVSKLVREVEDVLVAATGEGVISHTQHEKLMQRFTSQLQNSV